MGSRIADGKKENGDYIFTFHDGPVMDVETAFKLAINNAGVDDVTFHDLRRTVAGRLIFGGWNPEGCTGIIRT